MKSTSNSSEAVSSVLGSSGLVGVDTLPGRSDRVETSGKVYGLSWAMLETGWTLAIQGGKPSSRDALVPLRACRGTNAEGTQPSGRKLALAVQQREISGVKHDLLAIIELQMPMALVILLFL